MTEKQFENKLKNELRKLGIYRLGNPGKNQKGWWLKNWGGGRYVPSGVPDMQIVIGYVSLNVELKSETGKASAMQIQKLRQINDCGGYGILLRPNDLTKFLRFVKDIILYGRTRIIYYSNY